MHRIRPWLTIVRLGLVQASIGALVVFATSTLNRVMVVEFARPALVPGALVGFHYAVQMSRPRLGHGSDRGGRRTPWLCGGMAVLALGVVLAALATVGMSRAPWPGFALAALAYGLIGIGVGAAGTSLLVLLAQVAGEARRAAAATVVWMMMIAGFIVSAVVAGTMLAPFSPGRLVEAAMVLGTGSLVLSVMALAGVERAAGPRQPAPAHDGAADFRAVFREVWSEVETRRFTIFVFLSMLAFSAQELILEPFAGIVFGLAPAGSAKLAGQQHAGLLLGMITVAVAGSVAARGRARSMRVWTSVGCLASGGAALAVAAIGASGKAGMLHAGVVALGIANGAFSIAAVAGMMELSGHGRPGRQGMRMGLWGAAQAVAFACGGVIGTGASDALRRVLGSPATAYGAVFVGEAVLFCAAGALALRAFPDPARSVDQDARIQGAGRRWAT